VHIWSQIVNVSRDHREVREAAKIAKGSFYVCVAVFAVFVFIVIRS
jgi:hypothetical protein